MSVSITRPNGKAYRPRSARAVILGDEDELYEVIVLGTHDVEQARAFATEHVASEVRRWQELGFDRDTRITLDAAGNIGWWRREFAGFVDDSPHYYFPVDPERGAAGVSFGLHEHYTWDDCAACDRPLTDCGGRASACCADCTHTSNWPNPEPMFEMLGSPDGGPT